MSCTASLWDTGLLRSMPRIVSDHYWLTSSFPPVDLALPFMLEVTIRIAFPLTPSVSIQNHRMFWWRYCCPSVPFPSFSRRMKILQHHLPALTVQLLVGYRSVLLRVVSVAKTSILRRLSRPLSKSWRLSRSVYRLTSILRRSFKQVFERVNR